MTKEEALKMQGTEFTYIFEDGDTILAYVKKIDAETGMMSCWSLSLVTEQGYEFKPRKDDERVEQAICVTKALNWPETFSKLQEIHDNGSYRLKTVGSFSGCPF